MLTSVRSLGCAAPDVRMDDARAARLAAQGSPEIGEFGTVSSCRADVTIGMHFEQLSEP